MRVTVTTVVETPPKSVGLVCSCGLAVATIPGTTATCSGCGAVWLISAMLLVAPPIDP